MKSWVLVGIVSLVGLTNAKSQEVQQAGGLKSKLHPGTCQNCEPLNIGGGLGGHGGGFGGGHGGLFGGGGGGGGFGGNSQANHPWAYRPYGSLFGHGQQLPVFQAAPWYLYFPYNAHFQTAAPIGGGYFPPPVMGGAYGGGYGGGMPYFPATSPMMSPAVAPQPAPAVMPNTIVPVPAIPTKMPIVIPPATR